jgi:hypothetical protein
MTAIRYAGLVGAVLLLSYVLAHLWLNSPWSEAVWSHLNQWIENGQNPGLVSDIELVLVLLCALVLATSVVLLALGCYRKSRR